MSHTNQNNHFTSGFVAVVGYPNVGKSTLVNALTGEKVSIVSSKPQTTRNRTMGILHRPNLQIVFLDTPGIHQPQDKLGEQMVKGARGALEDVDVVLFVVDGTRSKPGRGDQRAANFLSGGSAPAILVVNKTDKICAGELDERLAAYQKLAHFDGSIGVSALTGARIPKLLDMVVARIPPGGPPYFPEDMVTDQPLTYLAGELVREKILELTQEEIPYSTAVVVREAEARPNDRFYIAADIIVERGSQKGILIGKGGRMIKRIGEQARTDVEHLLGVGVYLDLFVRVEKRWRNRPAVLQEFGLLDEE